MKHFHFQVEMTNFLHNFYNVTTEIFSSFDQIPILNLFKLRHSALFYGGLKDHIPVK